MSEIMTTANPVRPVRLHESWAAPLAHEFNEPYLKELRTFLVDEIKSGKTIYPKPQEYFAALDATPLPLVKVVILGQDPYHGAGQAHGLCFSVRPGVALPPSLKNIFKELYTDLSVPPSRSGCLLSWAHQGVLMLNSVLSVEAGRPGSHQGKGWEIFTDRVISLVNEHRENVVFLLWGSYAQKKASFVDPKKHLVLKAAHPSPFSAHSGFFGCRHFSKTNEYLLKNGSAPIEWAITENQTEKNQVEN